MKFTDDIFIKILLNKFNKDLDIFLKDYSLEKEQIGKDLAYAKSSAMELFESRNISPEKLASVSGAIKTQLSLLDKAL